MQEPPGELVTKENFDLCQMKSEIMYLWAKFFLSWNVSTFLGIDKKKKKKKKKNDNFHENRVDF